MDLELRGVLAVLASGALKLALFYWLPASCAAKTDESAFH